MRWVLLTGVGLSITTAAIAAEPDGLMSITDPAQFAADLRDMGYEPDPFSEGAVPQTLLHSDGNGYSAVLGGCTNGTNCKYMVLVSSFTDVLNPPEAWVAKQNVEYDMIKVWVNDSKELAYSTPVVVNGMSRASLKATIDHFINSGDSLAREALVAGLTSQPAVPPK